MNVNIWNVKIKFLFSNFYVKNLDDEKENILIEYDYY